MQIKLPKHFGEEAFTVAEMVVCFAIMALTIGGMITAYSHAGLFATRAAYQLAAEAEAVKIAERVRAANWDTQTIPATDNTTNFPSVATNFLELPISGTNVVYCTNYLSVSTVVINSNLNATVKLIQVTTMWPWNGVTMSNTIVTYRAPDQ